MEAAVLLGSLLGPGQHVDFFSHAQGDRVLKEVGDRAEQALFSMDFALGLAVHKFHIRQVPKHCLHIWSPSDWLLQFAIGQRLCGLVKVWW